MRFAAALSWLPLCLLQACTLPMFEVAPRYGLLAIDGDASLSTSGSSGSVDLDEAGLDDDRLFSGLADFKFGAPHLVLLGQSPHFTGQGTLSAAVDDGVDAIPSGAAVDSDVDLALYDGALVFDLVPGDTFEVALGLGGSYLDLDFSFEELGTGTLVDSAQSFGVPLVAGIASVQLGSLQLAAYVGGTDFRLNGNSVTYWDGDAFLRWRLLGGDQHFRGSLVLGYRVTHVDGDYDDGSTQVSADVDLRGPYAGIELGL